MCGNVSYFSCWRLGQWTAHITAHFNALEHESLHDKTRERRTVLYLKRDGWRETCRWAEEWTQGKGKQSTSSNTKSSGSPGNRSNRDEAEGGA